MMRRRSAVAAPLSVVLALGAACSVPQETAPAPGARAPLGRDVVARVGGSEVRAASVAAIASAQELPPEVALEAAVRDALLAEGARELLGPEATGSFDRRALLAATLLAELRREAERGGPVTDEELREATARHWLELDRPEAWRTVHAVVRFSENDPDARRAEGRKLASSILEAARSAGLDGPGAEPPEPGQAASADPLVARFREAVSGVNAKGFEVRVEELPPVAADGRVVHPAGGEFDSGFSRTAASLGRRGELGEVAETPFGAHVILLLERVAGKTVPADERRAVLRPEILDARAREAQQKLLAELRPKSKLAPRVDALLAEVAVEPPRAGLP